MPSSFYTSIIYSLSCYETTNVDPLFVLFGAGRTHFYFGGSPEKRILLYYVFAAGIAAAA